MCNVVTGAVNLCLREIWKPKNLDKKKTKNIKKGLVLVAGEKSMDAILKAIPSLDKGSKELFCFVRKSIHNYTWEYSEVVPDLSIPRSAVFFLSLFRLRSYII